MTKRDIEEIIFWLFRSGSSPGPLYSLVNEAREAINEARETIANINLAAISANAYFLRAGKYPCVKYPCVKCCKYHVIGACP